MKNRIQDYLSEFDNYSDKTKLADIIIRNLQVEKNQLDDFNFLQNKFNIKLTTEEKFKLEMLKKSLVFSNELSEAEEEE